jgi:hypothetical protein
VARTYRRDQKPRWTGRAPRASRLWAVDDPGGGPDGRPRVRGDEFRCRHCKLMVGPVPWGGHNRNHCPYCLYSRHVDRKTPGDRASDCGGSMAPAGVFTRGKGEHVLVHRCLSCGVERYNRIAADDDFEKVLALPVVVPPADREGSAAGGVDSVPG